MSEEVIEKIIAKLINRTDEKSILELCYTIGYRNSLNGVEFEDFEPENEFAEQFKLGRIEGRKLISK